MSTAHSIKEAQMLAHSMGQMYVNAPSMMKKPLASRKDEASFLSLEDDSLVPLSPPPTIDIRQKRERSDSLMLCHKNESLTTKRRLRSRSRIELDADAIMTPPCSSNPRERTRGMRSQFQEPNENFYAYPKTLEKHLPVNPQTSSVFITPCSEETHERKPLVKRDLNAPNETSFDSAVSMFHDELISTLSDSSDSESETIFRFEDKTRTKLTFDEEASRRRMSLDFTGARLFAPGKTIVSRIGLKHIDFIKELVNLNCEEICKQIFCHLEPENLQRVASVSKLWRRICKKDRIASPRLDKFIHGRKQYVLRKGKENLGSQTKFNQTVPHRNPFGDLKNNTMWRTNGKKSDSDNEASDKIRTDVFTCEKMKCPFCGSPSRKIGEQMCECDKCQEKFCSSCQHRMDQYHKAKCEIKPKSKKGKAKEVIGSKKSKSRLKRF